MSGTIVVRGAETVASSVTELLREDGHGVQAVTDPRGAVEAFGAFQPDVVILGVLMPSVDGISLCLQLRRETDVPVLTIETARGFAYRLGQAPDQ